MLSHGLGQFLLDDLLQMVWALDEPYGGGLPSWYVFRFMAGDVKVGLTGTGGDELFGNYRRFVPFETARLARFRRSFERYYFEPSYYFTDAAKRALLDDDASTSEYLQNIFDQSGSTSARDSVRIVFRDRENAPVKQRVIRLNAFGTAADDFTVPADAKLGYYTVKPGDTLIRVGLETGQNWKDLVKWNGLDNPNVIEVGQVLHFRPRARAVA